MQAMKVELVLDLSNWQANGKHTVLASLLMRKQDGDWAFELPRRASSVSPGDQAKVQTWETQAGPLPSPGGVAAGGGRA
eukprot:547073-Hanusia_phi.AAC.1